MTSGVCVDDAVNSIAGVLNSQHGQLAGHVITLLNDRMLWQGEGMYRLENWLAWRVGVSPATAASLVVIGRRAGDLPVCFAAFQAGELSLDQMAAIARKAPWWTDQQTCRLSTMMTVSQIRHLLGKYPFPNLDEDGREIRFADLVDTVDEPAVDSSDVSSAEPQPAATEEWCSMVFGEDGVFRLNAAMDFDSGHIFKSALDEARDRLYKNGQADVSMVDALREMAETSLGAISDPARVSRFKVSMFINADHEDGEMVDAAGWNVPDAIRRYITCDGLITPIFLEDGIPVSVGRSQRIVPERTRRLIEHRDHGRCRVPGCTNTSHLEVHHIIHWEYDGTTDTWNLVLICAYHHRLHHKHKLGITGNADDPDGLVFTNQHGLPIQQSGASPNLSAGPTPQPAKPYQPPLGERLNGHFVYFQPPPAHIEELKARAATTQQYLDSLKRPKP